jgi:hypothetical protein
MYADTTSEPLSAVIPGYDELPSNENCDEAAFVARYEAAIELANQRKGGDRSGRATSVDLVRTARPCPRLDRGSHASDHPDLRTSGHPGARRTRLPGRRAMGDNACQTPTRARAAQLTAIDPGWNCPWPLDWQRHYRILADLAADEPGGSLPDIAPGVQMDGDDLGRWLQRQKQPATWTQLSTEQHKRLTTLGVKPAEQPSPAPEAKSGKGAQKAVPRGHVETVFIDGQEHEHKLGVWYANQKQRRDKLTDPQRAALTELGIEWA